MTKIIGKISVCFAVIMLTTVFFAISAMAAVIDFSEVTTPETAYLACETVEKNATEYKVGETITFRIEFRSGNDLVSVPKFNYSIKAEDDTSKSGTVSGENGYFEVSTSISKPGLVQITVTPRNEDGTELKNGTSSYSMVGGACADLENIKMVMAEPDDFDKYWDAAIDELHTVFPNILKIEKDTANSTTRYDVYRIYIACAGKKEFLNTAAEGEEPNGDTYVAAKLAIDKEIEPGNAKFALSYQGAGIYSSPGVAKKAGYITLCVSAHSILIDQSDDYYSNIKSSVLPGDYLRRQEFNDNAEISYKKYIFLRDLQAVRFLKEFFGENGGGQGTVDGVDTSAWAGLWDGTTIEVSGSSQGGWQSLAVAALDHDVTKMTANVPGMSDIYSDVYEPGRDFYDSGYYHYSQKYFDGVSLAKRIICDSYLKTGLGDKQCPASIVICVYNALNTKKELTIWQCMPHSQGKTYADGTAKPSWTYSENFKLGYSDSLTFDYDISAIDGTAVSLGDDGRTITADSIGTSTVTFVNGRPSIMVEVVPAVLNIAITNGISGDTSDFEDGLDIAFSNRRDELIRIADGWDDFASEISEGKYIKGESYYFLMDDGNGSFTSRNAAAQALKASFTASGADYCAMIAEPSLGVTSSAMYAMQLMPNDYPDMYVVGKSDADLVSVGRASGNAILSIVDANQPYDENVIDVYNTATGKVMNTFDTIAEGENCPIAIVPSQPHSIRDGIEYSVEGLNISDMLVITGDSNGGKIVVNSKEYIITNSCIDFGTADNYSWVLDNNYNLIISGKAIDASFDYLAYADKIKTVTLEEGITEVASGAFAGLTALESIKLPHSLDTVADDAISTSAALEIIAYENNEAAIQLALACGTSITSLGLSFDAGDDLMAVLKDGTLTITGTGTTVNPGTKGYGSWVNSSFYPYFNKITKVIIGPSVTTVYNDAFANMDALLTVEIPAGLTKLNSEAFAYCDKLNTIYISGNEPIEGTFDLSNITSFSNYALHSCSSVKNVILGNITTISKHAFSRCASLETVTVNNTNTVEVMENAFYNSALINKSMKTVIFKGPMTATATSFSDVAMNIYVASAEDAEAFNALGYVNAKAVFLTDASSAIAHEGFAVRIEGYNGLRSFFSFDNSVLEANKMGGSELVEYGVVLASRENYEKYGVALISDGENYITANSKIVKKAVFKGETQVGKTLSTSDDDFVRFAATVTNFSSNYTSDIYFCGYEIWKTADGTEKIFYTDCADDDYDFTNIYSVSLNTYKNGLVNAQNDKESIVWNILSEAGAVTLNAGTDYTLTDGLTDLDGNPFGDTFVFRDVIAATQSSSTSTKLLKFGKGTSKITLLSDPAGGYIAVYRPVGETGSVPSIANSAYNASRGNQLHSNFGTNYTHNSIAYTVDTARPNPTVSSNIYKNIHTVILDYGITSIGTGAFANNGYATTYIYPTSLTTLNSYVFYAASGITTMFRADPDNPGNIENGLVDLSMISTVGTSYLFTVGINIAKLHLPGNLTSISDSFVSVSSKTTSALQKVWCGDTAEPKNGIIDLTGANITSIKGAAFRGAKNITTLILPDSCTSIASTAFNGSNGGSEKNKIMSSFTMIIQAKKVDAISTYCGTSVSYVDFDGKAH